MCHLTKRICSDRCIIKEFHHYANVGLCKYTNLDGRAYYTPWLNGTPSYIQCIVDWNVDIPHAVVFY